VRRRPRVRPDTRAQIPRVRLEERPRASPPVGRPRESHVDGRLTSVTAAKRALNDAVEGTYRGAGASASERAAVEEAQVALETLDAAEGEDIDLDLLAGKWRLSYTTAADVLSVLRIQRDLGPLSPVEVGDIYQSFSCGRTHRERDQALGALPPSASHAGE
jgi:hypothetical protein